MIPAFFLLTGTLSNPQKKLPRAASSVFTGHGDAVSSVTISNPFFAAVD
jgi:hypothetical protein